VTQILLVGESPSPRGDGRPFTGLAGQRITNLLGFDLREVMDPVNLFNYVPERWSPLSARQQARMILRSRDHERIILCGSKVSDAFHCSSLPLYQWQTRKLLQIDKRKVARIPHPSGRSRVWNYPLNQERLRRFLINAVH
jgi:hypothetical protein